jgi:hypothetical protein
MNKSERLKILDDFFSGTRARDSEVDEAFRLQADPEYRAREREAEERRTKKAWDEQLAREDTEREQRNIETNRFIGLLVVGSVSAWALYDIIRHRYGWVALLAWAALTVFACIAAWKGPAVKKDGPQFWWRALEVMGILWMLISYAMFEN